MKRALPLLAVLFIAILAGHGMLGPAMPGGHDALEYPTRLVEYVSGWRSGEIWPLWAPDLSHGYGQPFFAYNPPAAYILAGAIDALVAPAQGALIVPDMERTWNLFALALPLLAALFMVRLSRERFGELGGITAAALYVCAPYFLCDLYVRSAMAEALAFAWLPLLFFGIASAYEKGRAGDAALVATATALLLLTHNPAVLAAALCAAVFLLLLFAVDRNPRKLSVPIIGAAIGAALTAFYWLPALLGRKLIETGSLISDSALNYRNHFLDAFQWFVPRWGYGLSVPGNADTMPFHLGIVPCIFLAAGIVFAIAHLAKHRKIGPKNSFTVAAFGTLLFALFMTHSASDFLWRQTDTLAVFQFPWRFMMIAAFMAAVIGGLVVKSAGSDSRVRVVVIALILAAVALAFPHAQNSKSLTLNEKQFQPRNIARSNLSATTRREYRPKEAPAWPPLQRHRAWFVDGAGKISRYSQQGGHISFHVESETGGTIQVRQFDFPGWTAAINNNPIPHTKDPATHAMQLGIPPGRSDVTLRFSGLPRSTAAGVLSLATLLALIAFCAVTLRKQWRLLWQRLPIAQTAIAVVCVVAVVSLIRFAIDDSAQTQLIRKAPAFVEPIGERLLQGEPLWGNANRPSVNRQIVRDSIVATVGTEFGYRFPGMQKIRLRGDVGLFSLAGGCESDLRVTFEIRSGKRKPFRVFNRSVYDDPVPFDIELPNDDVVLSAQATTGNKLCGVAVWMNPVIVLE